MRVFRLMEKMETSNQRPVEECTIVRCGELTPQIKETVQDVVKRHAGLDLRVSPYLRCIFWFYIFRRVSSLYFPWLQLVGQVQNIDMCPSVSLCLSVSQSVTLKLVSGIAILILYISQFVLRSFCVPYMYPAVWIASFNCNANPSVWDWKIWA